MPFSPGTPKPAASGRKAGTANRSTAQAQQIAEEMGVDPIRVLLMLADGDVKGLGLKAYKDGNGRLRPPGVPLDVRCQAATAAARHLYPQLKAVDLAVSDNPFTEIMALSPEELERRRAEIALALADDDAAYSPPSALDSGEQSAH